MNRLRKVLLIDDDPVQLRIRDAVLRGAGFSTDTATTAEDALALLRSQAGTEVGLVITDHVMPHLRGAEFVHLLRDARPDLPVVVISGLPLPDLEAEYAGLDVTCRMKPCLPGDLIALVGEIVKPS